MGVPVAVREVPRTACHTARAYNRPQTEQVGATVHTGPGSVPLLLRGEFPYLLPAATLLQQVL